MKNYRIKIAVMLIAASLLCSSCVGSFGMFNHLRSWNKGLGDKFVNELVFVALHIVPVYEIAYLSDILVLNSIEFWSGSNPMTASNTGKTEKVTGNDGNYIVQTNENGYTIIKEGEENALELVYNEEDCTWNAKQDENYYEIMKMNDDGTATFTLENGETETVSIY